MLVGLKSIGYDMRLPMVRRAVAWLKSVQQRNGAWGESCRSYDDPAWAGKGEATASQTAWALLGLIAAGEGDSPEVRAGIDWLLATQQEDGDWKEDPVHRHRLSQSVLPEVPPVFGIFSPDGNRANVQDSTFASR